MPLLGILGSLAAYFGLIAILIWAPRLRRRWMRITSRILAGVGVAPLVVALPAILLGLALAGGRPATQTRIVRSPDGQEATLHYDAGFLGRDYTEITLKHTGCCQHAPIFWHAGPSWFDDPKIEWVDNRHLRLTYHARPDDPQHCEHQSHGTIIACTSLPLSNQSSPIPPRDSKP